MSFSMPIKKVVIVLFIQRPSQGWSWDTFLASFDYEVRENASFIYFKLFFMPIHFSHVVVLVCVGWSCSCPGHTSTSIWLRNNWNNKSSNIYWSSGKCLSGDYNLIFQGPIPSIKSSHFFWFIGRRRTLVLEGRGWDKRNLPLHFEKQATSRLVCLHCLNNKYHVQFSGGIAKG